MKTCFKSGLICCAFFLAFPYFSYSQCTPNTCPLNEADLANGGDFCGDCTVNVGAGVTITGDVVWHSGRLTINASGCCGADGDLIIDNDGSVTIMDGATLDLDDGSFQINNGGTLTVESGGAVEVLAGGENLEVDGDLIVESGATVDVAYMLIVDNTGDVTIAGTLTTGNDVEIEGGRVVVEDGGELESGDDIQVYDDGVLRIDEGGVASTSGANGDVMNSDDDGNPDNGESQGTIIVNGTLNASRNIEIVDTDPNSVLIGSGTIVASGNFDDEEEGGFSSCGGGGAACSPVESSSSCDETTSCTPGACPTENDLANGGVFCGNCTINVGNDINLVEDVCWVSGNLVLQGGDGNFHIEDGATLTVVGGSITIEDGEANITDGNLVILDGASFDVESDMLNVYEDGVVEVSGDLTTDNDIQVEGGTIVVHDGGELTSGDDIQVYDGGTFIVEEGGTASTTGGHGDLMNSDDDGNPDNAESQGTIIIDGTMNVSNDVEIYDSNPQSALGGEGTIEVDGNFVDQEGGTFSGCAGGGACNASPTSTCDEVTSCTEDNCPVNENDLENGGTFCGDCYLNVGGAVDITEDVCWVSGTLTIDGNGNAGEFDLEPGVTFTVVGGSVIVEDGGVDVLSGSNLVILEDGEFTVGDELRVDEGGTVLVDGVLNVANNIDVGETVTGTVIVNDGGSVNAESVNNDTQESSDDLPDNIVIADGGNFNVDEVALPVVWYDFTVSLYENGKAGMLQWATATEINNHGFYIEKSIDGKSFEALGFVEGNGNSKAINTYQFIDTDLSTNSYYRLKQVDYDGQFSYSNTLYLSIRKVISDDLIKVYPNPSRGKIVFDGDAGDSFQVLLVDISGQIMLQLRGVSLTEAEENVNAILSDLHKGTFVLKFVSSQYAKTFTIIRQ